MFNASQVPDQQTAPANRVPRRVLDVSRPLDGDGLDLPRPDVVHLSMMSPQLSGLELLSAASGPYERRWRQSLRRLRELLESGELQERRLAVAGGNPHATGIP